MKKLLAAAGVAAVMIATPVLAQTPGAPDVSRVAAATYKVDANHTQAVWSVDHMGFSILYGMFGSMSGTLTLDPAKPEAAKVSIEIPMSGLTTTSAGFTKHLSGADFFDVEKFPTAKFESTSVVVSGQTAKITGDLTLNGVTKPVVLDAVLNQVGDHPMAGKPWAGFSATTTLIRSDFGLGKFAPYVSDEVQLQISIEAMKTD